MLELLQQTAPVENAGQMIGHGEAVETNLRVFHDDLGADHDDGRETEHAGNGERRCHGNGIGDCGIGRDDDGCDDRSGKSLQDQDRGQDLSAARCARPAGKKNAGEHEIARGRAGMIKQDAGDHVFAHGRHEHSGDPQQGRNSNPAAEFALLEAEQASQPETEGGKRQHVADLNGQKTGNIAAKRHHDSADACGEETGGEIEIMPAGRAVQPQRSQKHGKGERFRRP
ncbi:hypothetical protein D3C86_1143590 [compost metagenome]